MPYKDPQRQREYLKQYHVQYHQRRYTRRKQQIFEFLGRRCAVCGGTDDLEIDHITPALKSFGVLQRWTLKWEVLVVEVRKCQLLCGKHHAEKHYSGQCSKD